LAPTIVGGYFLNHCQAVGCGIRLVLSPVYPGGKGGLHRDKPGYIALNRANGVEKFTTAEEGIGAD